MNKLRMRFSKTGRAIYISHLDLMQTMQRAFSRADYALKYSEGFNPHPQISIALPLSVGSASLCEFMDFRLLHEEDLTQIPARLTAALPEGIEVYEVYEPARKCAEIKWLKIEGRLEYDHREAAVMLSLLRVFFAQESIVITKKTKRGTGESNIRPAIHSIDFSTAEDAVILTALLSAQEPTLNPELLVESLRQLCPELAPDFARFMRLEAYDKDMTVFR